MEFRYCETMETFRTLLCLAGIILVIAGVAAWSLPGACIVGGTAAIVIAVLLSRAAAHERRRGTHAKTT